MNWTEIAAIVTILACVVSASSWFVKDQNEKGLLRLETRIGKWRGEDKEEMRQWINGSFMRAGETGARLDAQDQRLDQLERRQSARF